MSRNPPWSTSSCCGSERRGRRPAARRALLAVAFAAVALSASGVAWAASTRHPPILVTLRGPEGERDVEAKDLRLVYFKTTYRHTRAPRDESPSGERIEVVDTRDECRCIRFNDWSRVKMSKLREIDITYTPGDRVAVVRLTRREGGVNEYPAVRLYGGDGLFPPLFSATIDGDHREFPLILEGRPDARWPEETLIRVLFVRAPPPPAAKGHRH